MYSQHLAFVHDAAFTDFSRRVGPEIVRILRKARISRGIIVEVGCGSGVLAARLVAAGYTVRGFDRSRSMIRLARARVPKATFRVADLTRASIEPCAAVVCVGEVVTYVSGGLRALRGFFRRVYDALPPGGLFLFDFIHSADHRTYATKALGRRNWRIEVRADYDARARVLTRRMVTIRHVGSRTVRAREVHRVRVYDRRQMVAALEAVGFRVTTGAAFGRYRLLEGDTAVVACKGD